MANQAYGSDDWRKKAAAMALYACAAPCATIPQLRCDRLDGHPGMHGVTSAYDFYALWADDRSS